MSCSNTPISVNCKQYKTGRFRFSLNDVKKTSFIIERNNNTQTEKYEDSGIVCNYKINWKDECTYQLVYLNGNENQTREEQDIQRKLVIDATIISGTEDYYIFEASNNLDEDVLKDTMWVVK
jgi:hypothetical protein